MRISLVAALAGSLTLLPSAAAQSACTVTAQNLVMTTLPSAYGGAVVKLRAGPVLGAGRNDIVALTDAGRLVLVRDGFALDAVQSLAENIIDFTVAHVDGNQAQVVAIGSAGLFVGTYYVAGASGPTLKFDSPLVASHWNMATRVDAASQGGVLQIVGVQGATLLRASYNPSNQQITPYAPTTVPAPVEFLAVADFYPDAGVEVVVGSSALLHFYKGLANPTVAIAANPLAPMPTASFIDVQRIPKGADLRDSIGVIQRHPSTDVFYELTSAVDQATGSPSPSSPIATGALRLAAIAYGPIGLAPGCTSNCLPTDLAFVATSSETIVFQGDPQAAGGMQFSYDAAQLSALHLEPLVNLGTPFGLSVTAGDLDGDGDGDLAYAGTFTEGSAEVAKFVLVRNDCTAASSELVDVDCASSPGVVGASADDTLAFQVELSVPKPSAFPQHPTHADVTIYVRQYSTGPSNPDISPYPIFSQKRTLTPPAPGSVRSTLSLVIAPIPLLPPWDGPPTAQPLSGFEVIAYVQVTPVLFLENGVELHGPSSNFIGADVADLLDALCANELSDPDELFGSEYCETDTEGTCGIPEGAPLINELHRRKRIRPIGTPPQ